MKDTSNTKKNSNLSWLLTIFALIAFFALRCLISWKEGVFLFPLAGDDDLWVLRESQLRYHFQVFHPGALCKNMSGALFFTAISYLHLPYEFAVCLLYLCAGLLIFAICFNLSGSKILSLLGYVLTLFMPFAFDSASIRLYRLGILPPVITILFALMVLTCMMLLKDRQKVSSLIIMNLLVAFVGLFAVYIKEDGIWIVVCLAFFTAVELGICFTKIRRLHTTFAALAGMLLVVSLPIGTFCLGTEAYKKINYHFFGVEEVNTRTEGEVADFMSRIYKIQSNERTYEVWAPKETLEKAIEASPTLKAQKELTKYMLSETMGKFPMDGDRLGWRMLECFRATGIEHEYAKIQELFRQINAELDEAFENGTLEKDTGIQLISSAGSRKVSEIPDILQDTFRTLWFAVGASGYNAGGMFYEYDTGNPTELASLEMAAKISGDDRLLHAEDYLEEKEKLEPVLQTVNSAAGFLQACFFLLAALAFFVLLVDVIRKPLYRSKKVIFIEVGIFVFTGISLVYALGIAWYSAFVGDGGFIGYGGPLEGILIFVYIFGLIGCKEKIMLYLEEKQMAEISYAEAESPDTEDLPAETGSPKTEDLPAETGNGEKALPETDAEETRSENDLENPGAEKKTEETDIETDNIPAEAAGKEGDQNGR